MAGRSAVFDHIRMLEGSADYPVPVISTKKFTDWLAEQDILEYLVNTNNMMISIPTWKIDEDQLLCRCF